jgi:hypothetical protein
VWKPTLVDMTNVDEGARGDCDRTRNWSGSRRRRIPCSASPDISALAALAQSAGAVLRRGQHLGNASPAARVRARRRHLDARHHEVSGGHSDVLGGALVAKADDDLSKESAPFN